MSLEVLGSVEVGVQPDAYYKTMTASGLVDYAKKARQIALDNAASAPDPSLAQQWKNVAQLYAIAKGWSAVENADKAADAAYAASPPEAATPPPSLDAGAVDLVSPTPSFWNWDVAADIGIALGAVGAVALLGWAGVGLIRRLI